MFNTKAYQQILQHFQHIKSLKICELLQDHQRSSVLIKNIDYLTIDYSKNQLNQDTINLFAQLANELSLTDKIQDMYKAKKINFTENRAVGHIALRDSTKTFIVDEHNYQAEIQDTKENFLQFAENIRLGKLTSYDNQQFKTIVNIGIGGSYLGTQMMYNALKAQQDNDLKVYFISNIDAENLLDILNKIDFATTLFVIASKTFTTLETITNTKTILQKFLQYLPYDAISHHFVALSSNINKVQEYGIKYIFNFWDFIGGRYSIWSCIALPLAIKIGRDNFIQLLNGAKYIDDMMINLPLIENIPFLSAIIGIWYNNFFNYHAYCIIPYDYRLRDFTKYIQQLEMESNGKSTNYYGEHLTSSATAPLVFGEPGTDAQHSFFQLLHQGTNIIPCDFIGFAKCTHNHQHQHDALITNMFAQSEALMQGRDIHALPNNITPAVAPHKVFFGNRPSTTFLFDQLTPYTIGMLCAIYEHKTFIQGLFWEINSFDQWGVELGKELASKLAQQLENNTNNHNYTNSSTQHLMQTYLKKR